MRWQIDAEYAAEDAAACSGIVSLHDPSSRGPARGALKPHFGKQKGLSISRQALSHIYFLPGAELSCVASL
jgi:hypothetical protein